jgi:hypothetical protein
MQNNEKKKVFSVSNFLDKDKIIHGLKRLLFKFLEYN